MKLFIDSADPKEIAKLAETGLVDGVTTNPSLAAKAGLDYVELLQEICKTVKGPVSAEVLATDTQGMISEGKRFAKIANNIAIKVPMTWDGMKACRTLADADLMVNVTLCFSAVQALIAAKAGASFISPFVGRLDDAGQDGMTLIREIRAIYDNYDYQTEILSASIRSVPHVRDSAIAGADVATIPVDIFQKMIAHPLTDKGLAAFEADAKKAGVRIRDE
ncbi:MAG: fructose-6-phosphate aldolase [Alphaproteobacteria bacterium]|nr:fructose-6-phosphate aldolase [Alphaproteobacteria bacterium]MBV9903166.1 fructose-6-phosphate aldolase [Alphaproteobacteria bacterium]